MVIKTTKIKKILKTISFARTTNNDPELLIKGRRLIKLNNLLQGIHFVNKDCGDLALLLSKY